MVIEMGLKTKRIGMFSGLLVLMSILVASACASAQEDLPWSNETDVIILPWSNETDVIIIPSPPLPPFFRYFTITPTEIMLGEDLAISFVIENPNNQTITRMSATRIGDFFTQIIEIRLEAYESKHIYYRIIPHVVGEYDVWIDGQTGTFKVISTEIIIVVDPLEELILRMDDLNKELYILWTTYNDLQDADANLKSDQIHEYEQIVELEQALETYSNEVSDQIENLENKISRLQNSILYACIATAIIAVLGAFLLIKRMN
ncbi:hypothetical protein ES703_17603 [subsurface metagenome]